MKKIKGQITIFVALVFIVLFTVFGMVVSFGMFVHDKVNLQNATDLASYYVATKQAEMLEAIAHSNYQIRQSWKLLVFRYRVLGTASRLRSSADPGQNYRHPGTFKNITPYINDDGTPYIPAAETPGSGGDKKPPRVCIGATHLFADFEQDTFCADFNFNVNYINRVPSITLGGTVASVNSAIDEANRSINESCRAVTYLNWWYANTIVGAHRLEQRDRKAVIRRLAENLALPVVEGGMKDLNGEDVYTGAWKTFKYNLTESTKNSTDVGESSGYEIKISTFMEGVEPEKWLNEIYVNPLLPYAKFDSEGGGCGTNTEENVPQLERPSDSVMNFPTVLQIRTHLDPDEVIADVGSIGAWPGDNNYNITIGVEKNPWFMVYNQVRSQAKSSPLFNVLGKFIRIRATAYSKPFGGRIGPWYFTTWASGSSESNGTVKTDSRLPMRVRKEELGSTDVASASETEYPNFSRYPGDEKGLSTNAAMVAYGKVVGDWGVDVAGSGNPYDLVPTSYYDYKNATYSYFSGAYNDPLAQDADSTSDPTDSFNRRMEIAAITPDIFDMTYYTILPYFYDTHVKGKLDTWLSLGDPFIEGVKGDIGASENKQDYNIVDQFKNYELSNSSGDNAERHRRSAWLYMSGYADEKSMWMGVLNSWAPGELIMDYRSIAEDSAIQNKFMKCQTPTPPDDNSKPKIPSMCNAGGRVGYSVKMISGDYLRRGNHPIGGEGQTGALLNPPPKP